MLEDWKPDLVGITATTPLVYNAYKIGDFCHSQGFFTVMGGMHVSALPEEAKAHADCVVIGEGENALLEIMRKRIVKEMPSQVVHGNYIKDLDSIPMPAWNLMNMEFYIRNPDNPSKHFRFFHGRRTTHLLTSRGCPRKCVFCHNSGSELPVRYHSAERVIKEIQYVASHYGVDAILFTDDEFVVNKNRLWQIMALMRKEGLHKEIVWACQARSDSLNDPDCVDLLREMKATGCKAIMVGYESGSPRVLSFLKCGTVAVEDHVNATENIKKAGLFVYGNFMIGTIGETEEDITQTVKLVNRLNLDDCGLAITTPYPNTALWKTCVQKHLLPDPIDYEALVPNADVHNPKTIVASDMMTREQLAKAYAKAVRLIRRHRRLYRLMHVWRR
jgi:radical SAM superfamily enzyme YgiQ (UPF0313 family)